MSQRIATTMRSGLSVATVGVNKIDTMYASLKEVLEDSGLGGDFLNLFARPKDLPSDKSIDWYTDLNGEVVQVSTLDEGARAATVAKFETMSDALVQHARGLSEKDDADLLEKAAIVPDETFLYLVGGRLVAICWGFKSAKGSIAGENGTFLSGRLTRDSERKPPVADQPQPEIKVSGVELDATSLSLKTNATAQLAAAVSPAGATDKRVRWVSSNPSVATVDENGRVTTLGSAGTAFITVATASGGFTAQCMVTVSQPVVEVSGVALSVPLLEMKTNATAQLSATVSPADATDKSVAWTSSNAQVVSVDENGVVRSLAGEGSAVITASAGGGKCKAQCNVSVSRAVVEVAGLSLNPNSLEMKTNATAKLAATIDPAGATDKCVAWTSSNPSVASVDENGVVTSHDGAGSAVITASAGGGKCTAQCTVSVSKPNTVSKEPKSKLPWLVLGAALVLAGAAAAWWMMHKDADKTPAPDFAFLKGGMNMNGVLADANGRPVDLRVEFDGTDGHGRGLVKNDAQTCKGDATARMDGDTKVVIDFGELVCPDGDNFEPFSMTCPKEGDDCTGRNKKGGPEWPGKVTREGGSAK